MPHFSRRHNEDNSISYFIEVFLNLGTSDTLNPIILCDGSWPAHGRMFISIPRPHPLDARSTNPPTLVIITKNSPDIAKYTWREGGGQTHPWLRTPYWILMRTNQVNIMCDKSLRRVPGMSLGFTKCSLLLPCLCPCCSCCPGHRFLLSHSPHTPIYDRHC